jgi:hypothetical protein
MEFNKDLRYMSFVFKANDYGFRDWVCLYQKNEKGVTGLCTHWLLMGGHLSLIKFVLEASPFYYNPVAYIPVGLLETIRNKCFIYFMDYWKLLEVSALVILWKGNKEKGVSPTEVVESSKSQNP